MKKVINMLLKTYTPQKAAVNLAAHNLSSNTLIILSSEKESKLRKTGIFSESLRKTFMV